MKRALSFIFGVSTTLALTVAVHGADDAAKAGMLTKAQIQEGWILLFDGTTPFGWKVEGDSKIEDGVLMLGGDKASKARTNTEFAGYELAFEYVAKGDQARLSVNGQAIDLRPAGDGWSAANVTLAEQDGKSKLSSKIAPSAGGKAVAAEHELDKPGRTAVAFEVGEGGALRLRGVKLKPLGAKSLFNGKDLSGWKILPDHASKFAVTDKGELNIKDGNGEIQTEEQWADFVLQLDVFSNGEHLNSGVFFRAKPGQFWQGYEAQIRNEWEGYQGGKPRDEKNEDRTKPVDFGTGGIYNRQPSRKVVSNDKEWFTYTIVAHGNHIATWVNGFQTADYFDTARDANSARRGRYLGKGAVTLQGHDPTTDLSFRNIRLAGLPAK